MKRRKKREMVLQLDITDGLNSSTLVVYYPAIFFPGKVAAAP
jgi:hypothetical protein